jgi:hypothetical protein
LEESQNFWIKIELGEPESPKKPEEMEEPEEPKGTEKYGKSDEELSLPVQEGSSDKNEAELILQSITEMIVVTPKLQGIYKEKLRCLFVWRRWSRAAEKFRCLVCGKTACNGQHMRANIEAKHVSRISVKCRFCKVLCKTLASLAQHERKKH